MKTVPDGGESGAPAAKHVNIASPNAQMFARFGADCGETRADGGESGAAAGVLARSGAPVPGRALSDP